MVIFNHPNLGPVTGNSAEGCSQFLGIKYAALENRFSPPEAIKYDASGVDATKFGPQVISPPSGVDIELSFIQQPLPKPDFPGISDVDGLTLNITIPASSVEDPRNLPVLVFIHGGGYAIGGNWWPQYDFAKLVKLAADNGKPFIGIGINYRLGALGFLTNPRLRASGYKPNNGLRDQREALRWIRQHISGFGGDSENVTVLGESAGAVSAGYLLLSEEPLAKRLICLGGCPPLLGVVPVEVADQMAHPVLEHLGLGDVPAANLVNKLLEIPASDFITKIPPGTPAILVADGELIPRAFSFQSFAQTMREMPGSKWTESIMMGYSKLDASIMAYSGLMQRKKDIAIAFRKCSRKTLKDFPTAIEAILDHYCLSQDATSSISDEEALTNILKFISDVAFFLPAYQLASEFPNTAFLLSFNQGNPWEGPFKGQASHILDVAFLFQNYNDMLDEGSRAGATTLGLDIVAFVNGEKPWEPFNKGSHGIGIYANGQRQYRQSSLEGTHNGDFILKLANDTNGPGIDKLVEVFTNFMMLS